MGREIRFTSLMLVLVVLAGCGGSDSDHQKIVGQWQIDGGQTLSRSVSAADDNGESAGPRMIIEFTAAGGLSTTTKMGKIDSKKSGQWEFIAWEPQQSIYRLRCTLNGQVTEHAINFEESDAISWVPPNMAGTDRKIRFVRSTE